MKVETAEKFALSDAGLDQVGATAEDIVRQVGFSPEGRQRLVRMYAELAAEYRRNNTGRLREW